MSRENLMDFDSIYLEYKDYIYRTCILYLKDHHWQRTALKMYLLKYIKSKSLIKENHP